MTIPEIKSSIKRKITGQMIIMESATKNNNFNLAYESVNLCKAYIMLLMEIEEGENNASIK